MGPAGCLLVTRVWEPLRVVAWWSAGTPILQGGLFWAEGVPLPECPIHQEPRPPLTDILVAKGAAVLGAASFLPWHLPLQVRETQTPGWGRE